MKSRVDARVLFWDFILLRIYSIFFLLGNKAGFWVMMKSSVFERKALSVRQIQALDRKAIESYGVPSLALMENAGKAVADEAERLLKTVSHPRVAVVCGLGHNAGDGFVAARHLINAGVGVNLFVVGSPSRLKNDAAVYFRVLEKCGCKGLEIRNVTARFRKRLQNTDLIVDAIFGVGLNRSITGLYADVISALNVSGKKILAVDIPSGLDGTTGATFGTCVKAYKTVTFSFMKKGFFNQDAARLTGRVVVADIGIPRQLWPRK